MDLSRTRPAVDPVRAPRRQPTHRRLGVRLVATVAAVLAVAAGADAAYVQAYRGRAYPGVVAVGQPAGGLSSEQLRASLQSRADALLESGLTYRGRDRAVKLNPTAAAAGDPDLVYRWLEVDVDATVAAALSHGRSGNVAADALTHLRTLVGSSFVPARVEVDRARLRQALDENFGDLVTPARQVGVELKPRLALTDSAPGERWDYDSAVASTVALAERLSAGEVQLRALPDLPSLSRAEVPSDVVEKIRQTAEGEPLKLTYGDESWVVPPEQLAPWLRVVRHDGRLQLTADRASIENYLSTSVAPQLDEPATAMKFSIEGGKVAEFQPARDGRRLDLTESASAVIAAVERGWDEASAEVPLAVQVEPAPPSPDDVVGRSIRELVGVGRSNFSGSPKNRRHNIAVGAAAVNGTLIQPGEEFSLLKTLGTIDAAAGYLPELVIKGNRTIPEYGGGLCQIGTTTFRSALAAGTKITQRRNHSYRVSYYEPAGTDATIYDPAPDFRFINDYPTPLLFQTRIEGDDLTFELWGTDDGRVATSTKPTIFNVRQPPPRREVPTTDIPPGEVKCTERAHSGADTSFTYTVTYPDGAVHEEEFRSHYVPWQEVCLVGVTPEQLASSTAPATLPDADASGAAGT